MRFVTLPNIYVAGLLVSMIKSLFDICFRNTHVKVTVTDREFDLSYITSLVNALLWPIMLVFYLWVTVIGLTRFRKMYDDWLERKTGVRPTWTTPDDSPKE